ncbi:MAG: hypothetical protein GWM92_16125, partial [Gemmatimonadetes bacterium]|nr:hypothetical protein [Gemmatimonadota bacterium]NIR80277.1 hypothetical protein [Gemmatimonadota bacterium]NIT89035.1 hypothetical protein [Gemmatimonadota bacterium]NIU32833.1 hypothetical protein [Gemmatimonadota bacterium]NIU37253.1 hypothetical protein [Gemmatimonadota bacterium]
MRRLAALTIFAVFLGCLSPPEATAQEEDDDGFDVPAGFAGELELTNEFYENTGIDARRPPALTRLRVRPTLTLFGRFDVGLNLLVSTEGSDFRQNMDEVGINPSWGWGELHAGDFANPYSEYTMGEVRIRGGGLDLTPGPLRFSIQGGRLQRSVASGAEGSTFQRNAVAGRLGFGSEEGTYLDLHALKAEDDLESVERSLLIRDTTLADTIPDGLRPQVGTRPQENLVAGLEGQLVLFDRTLRLRGEAAVALITRDKLSSEAELEGTGVASLL